MPLPTQLLPEFQIVVDLAIKNCADRVVLVPNGLPSALEIDDRQPAHTERNASVRRHVAAFTIRSAVDQAAKHTPEVGLKIKRGRIDDACYAAHGRPRTA